MAKTKKFVVHRNIKRPYTRFSKFRTKSFIRTKPNSRVVRYDMGSERFFPNTLFLKSKSHLQIRDLAIESARLSCNRLLEKKIGKGQYKFKIRIYPHHVLRENPLAAGAGADRMSTGMAHSFGKIVGIAAQIKKGQVLFQVNCDDQHITIAREALKQSQHKLPCTCSIVIQKNTPKVDVKAKKAETKKVEVKKEAASA